MVLRPDDVVSILDVILEGIQIIGPDWRYLHLNETAARHGRSTREALLGRTMMECYPGIERTEVFAAMRRCFEQGTPAILDNEFAFADGSSGHFELRIQPVPQGLCVLSIDVTARKQAELAQQQAEQRLRHGQRMQALGLLAAGVAHDFNNLLAVMLAQVELAQQRPDGPQRADLDTIAAAARSSAELTRQLLAYGRRSAQSREVVELPEMLAALEPILRRSLPAGIELRIDGGGPVGRVEVDRSQLEQIVMNLVVNARDAIGGRGRISIALANAELEADYAAAHPGAQAGPHALLQVADTGHGMDAATQARIFEPFFTTKARGTGTGLGLSTVYGIVKQHGGNIWVYSEPGRGTTFKVYLPITERLPEAARPAPPPPAPLRGGETVLIAEDLAPLRKLLGDAFALAGFKVLAAATGDEAQALWRQHAAAIALLVTDVMLPGASGPELVRQFRAERQHLRVICTSGYADAHLVESGSMPDDVVFVEKPFSLRALLDQARQLLALPRARS